MTRIPKIAQLAAAALAGALLAGGGYALAASSTKTIHACANKTTHVLTLQKRCARTATSVTWNQRGPQGAMGRTGAAGPAGPQAVGAYGTISIGNPTASVAGENLAVTETGVGSALVTVTGGPCLSSQVIAPVVSPQTGVGSLGTPTPLAYTTFQSGSTTHFGVNVGTLSGGTFTPQDGIAVNIAVYCKTS